jgi:sucrose phosphorylase
MKNQVQLITYGDRLGGNLRGTLELLEGPLAGLFGGIHLLPFFYPIDGADAGFDPIDHCRVDAKIGTWDDVRAIARKVEVLADVIVNHVSSESAQFCDLLTRGADSAYAGMFLTLDRVFPGGAAERDLLSIYRPRPGLPFTPITLADGNRRLFWTTFTPRQIDIDVEHPRSVAYLDEILQVLAANGVTMIRLDAVGYAIKRAGSSCFMTDETFDFIGRFSDRARELGLEVLVEVHSYYRRQIEIARQVDWVYDFALPPLILHALITGDGSPLKRWIGIRPINAITVLDTHDGIGIIDIGSDAEDRDARPGLVTDAELDRLVEQIHANSRGESARATGAAASNLDLYQVNCTFFDALGGDDLKYLLARALQFFVPGIPQIYYIGLLAGGNDMSLLEKTNVGRDINRHFYTRAEIDQALERPVVAKLCELIRLRNTHPAFYGQFTLGDSPDHVVILRWDNDSHTAELELDLRSLEYRLEFSAGAGAQDFRVVEQTSRGYPSRRA